MKRILVTLVGFIVAGCSDSDRTNRDLDLHGGGTSAAEQAAGSSGTPDDAFERNRDAESNQVDLKPKVRLAGSADEKLTNGTFSAEIETIVEDMEVSPYSRNIGQRSLTFDVMLTNVGTSTIKFDEVVMSTVGSEGERHVQSVQIGSGGSYQLAESEELRVSATTRKGNQLVLEVRRNGESVSQPLTFDLAGADIRLSPILQRIKSASDSNQEKGDGIKVQKGSTR